MTDVGVRTSPQPTDWIPACAGMTRKWDSSDYGPFNTYTPTYGLTRPTRLVKGRFVNKFL